MRKFIYLILVCFTGLGCNQFDDLTQFEIEYTTQATIPGGAGVDLPFDVNTPNVESNSESKFENENTRKNLVSEVFLKSLVLDLKSPSNGDFSFLEEITIYISSSTQDEAELAYKIPVPESASSKLSLDVSGDNLKKFIVDDEFTLRLRTTTDEVITQDHDFEIKTVFDVKAKLFN